MAYPSACIAFRLGIADLEWVGFKFRTALDYENTRKRYLLYFILFKAHRVFHNVPFRCCRVLGHLTEYSEHVTNRKPVTENIQNL
jgi:hypothetical protein